MNKILCFVIAICLTNLETATAQSDAGLIQLSCNQTITEATANLIAESDREAMVLADNNLLNRNRILQEQYNQNNSQVSINTFQQNYSKKSQLSRNKITIAGFSLPSLWWAKQQFDPFGGRLIDNWLTYPQIKQIDLTVNWQLWTLLDYLGRYRFINQLGTVVREYGYSLRVFNQQQQCLAHYKYNDEVNPPKWEITIEGVGQDSLQIESTN